MRLTLAQLHSALAQKIAPLYLISGDEPLQLGEAADLVRAAAKKIGFLHREVLNVETGFDWKQLSFAADSSSIFSDKKIVHLHVPSGKMGADGAKALGEYCERLSNDTLLLISCGKIEYASLKAKWFLQLDKVGVVVQVYPLEGQELLQWLQQRLLKRGLQVDAAGIRTLAARVEGNLLAAAQEIEKLYVLYGHGTLSNAMLEDAVADSSRFDIFKLSEAALGGHVNRVTRILQALQAEGIAAPVVLWGLTREVRIMAELKTSANKEAILMKHFVRDKRKQNMLQLVARLQLADLQHILLLSAKADRQIKGQQSGDAWETLFTISLLFCGVKIMR